MPRLLDLFCGAGGAAMGYARAGFEVVGVDINPQPHYPFEFHQADAMTYPLDGFDAIHASPPCQAFTAMQTLWNAREHLDLLTPTRARLIVHGMPYVIENVPGAPMPSAVRLCGSSFGLGIKTPPRQLRRHRWFEASFGLWGSQCQHRGATVGLYGDHLRDRRRNDRLGHKGVDFLDFPDADRLALGREAMEMPWAENWHGLSQAIPPAYTEWIGTQLLAALEVAA